MNFERDDISPLLLKKPTAALRFCAQPDEVAVLLARRVRAADDQAGRAILTLEEVARFAQTDYRLIASAIHTCQHRSSGGQKQGPSAEPEHRLQLVSTLEDLRNADGLAIILYDRAYEQELAAFLEQCANVPGRFIEEQFDLPSRNAVFRDGVVKSWRLPHGTCVVSKRNNRRKDNRLLEEQQHLTLILDRIHALQEARVAVGDRTDGTCFTISRPICIIRDPTTTFCYAIWLEKAGESLEELLLGNKLSQGVRQQHLNNYRRCLDSLFDHGIVWRDMSPRNVLVEQRDIYVYHFVDFEKVEVRDCSLDIQSRIEACRTQFCVEEFGVICPEEDLLNTFSGLFLPTEWDLESDAPLPFVPRVEIAAVLAGRGIEHVSVGMFNRIDQQVREVRRPRVDPATDRLIRPGLLGFRVEHYLSLSAEIDCSDYDRKTTEVLLAAHANGRLIDAFRCLSTYIDALEIAIVVREFEAILTDGNSRFLRYPEREAQSLCAAIDALYMSADRPSDFTSVLQRYA